MNIGISPFLSGLRPTLLRDTISVVTDVDVGHDRETVAVDRPTVPQQALSSRLLQDALTRLRLEGAVFLRAEYREPWAYESLPATETAKILHPTSEQVILFHVVASGACWVTVDDGERHWAKRGDVIVLPYGDQHRMGGVQDAELVSIGTIMQMPPWQRMPVIRHGADGDRTDVVCGYLHSHDPLFDPHLRVFPPVFVVRPPDGPAAEWVRANVAYALERSETGNEGPALVMSRLPELLLVEVLRLHLASAPAAHDGWLAALNDPVLRPALALLHTSPESRWTVERLARETASSRSVLDARFREALGRSPIRYLTEWRMHLAEDLLATTDLGIGAVAHRVGYDAEEAFSRAFKRTHGDSPSVWRAAHAMR
jgi:AraC-like DNA-binding protein/mannose-6-phosphate isomerase-like protein (cupin superfamily)